VIYVTRPAIPLDVEEALNRPFANSGLSELETARAHYQQIPAPAAAYAFARYRDVAVCQALDRMFHEKCAYCESAYRAVGARNVEHFRPKGKVREAHLHPGYWWLASEWTNLLPSCLLCNQRRRALHFERGMTPSDADRFFLRETRSISGKGDSFPLVGTNWVTDEQGNLQEEDPLLINPCERHPDSHLEWIFEWDRGVELWDAPQIVPLIRPRVTENGAEDIYGKASITIYGLNRAGLVRERIARLRQMQMRCLDIIDLMQDLDANPDPVGPLAMRQQARLLQYRSDLIASAQARSPYASMGSAFVRLFDTEVQKLV
jgi:uncharacterized protein (TIGR02646 family)